MRRNSSYKILIIDDDPTLLLIAEKKLAQLGYQVLTRSSGQAGLQCLQEQKPDMLLLDYSLPDLSGVEVCQYLRNQPHGVIIPVLFITGKDDFLSIDKAFEAGATDFTVKPINWQILIYRIQFILRANEVRLSLLSSEVRLNRAQSIAKIANWDYNSENSGFTWSDSIFELLELDQSQSFGFQDFLNTIPEKQRENVRTAVFQCVRENEKFQLEHEIITANGNKKIVSHLGHVAIGITPDSFECMGTIQDITERHNTESRIRELACFDSLTGLMNRESFVTVLDKIISSNENRDQLSALLFIDLDDFKRVNDTLGHNYGDLLLSGAADRLKKCVRTAEQDQNFHRSELRAMENLLTDSIYRVTSLTINRFDLGRLGGDEFTIFLADIADKSVAESVAERVLKILEQPFFLDGHEVYVTFSIGIAMAPEDGDSIQTLLKNADAAMYCAKSQGKNNYQFYNQALNDRSLYRLMLESDLRTALQNNQLYLVYQPQICLKTGRLVGAEALLRWNHPQKGEIAPIEFIPLAEQTGQIISIGNWLFQQFYDDIKSWAEQGWLEPDFQFSLNISSIQFDQSTMMQTIQSVFYDRNINHYVDFEITESVMMKNADSNLEKTSHLVNLGISLSIDDFGTGFSSLSYLHRFPVKSVKIDRSFINNLDVDGRENIVKAIIAMAHGMNIGVVAEGIEMGWQLEYLQALQCDKGQGFYLYKPMLTPEFVSLLQKNQLNHRL